MLAACTKDALFVLDATTLKNPPTTVPVTTSLSQRPTASAWAADNSCLYVAGSNDISKFSPTGYLYSSAIHLSRPPTSLLTKDNGDTLIYTSGNEISLLNSTTGKELSRIDLQDQDATLLSLSKDEVSIAVCLTSGEVQVHDLGSGTSPVVLRSINGIGEEPGKRARYNGEVTALAFHAHSPTKLLLALGPRLLVYDTLQPAAPAKVFLLNRLEGKLVSIACSPFSKSLVAVTSNTGKVWLVDIAKDSGPFRTVSLHATITCIVFSGEGAALYAGTNDGRLLTVDLRALDKPAKVVTLSDSLPILCLSVQRKLDTSIAPSVSSGAKTTTSVVKRRNATPTERGVGRMKKPVPPSPSTTTVPAARLTSPTAPTRARTISATKFTSPAKTATTGAASSRLSRSKPPTPSGSRSRKVSIESPPPLPTRTRTTSGTSAVTSPSSRTTAGSLPSRALSSATSITSVSSPISRKPSRTGAAMKRGPVTPPPKSPRKSIEKTIASPTKQPRLKASHTGSEKPVAGPSDLSPRRTRTISESAVVTSTPARPSTSRTFSGPTTKPQSRDTNTAAASLRSPTNTVDRNTERARPRTVSSQSANTPPVSSPSKPRPTRKSAPSQPTAVSPIPAMPPLPGDEQLTAINMKWATALSRTPSPDFGKLPPIPGITVNEGEEVVASPVRKTASQREVEAVGTDVLGLGTVEIRRQIRAEQQYDTDDDDKAPTEEGADAKLEKLRQFIATEEPESEVVIEDIEVVRDSKDDRNADRGIRMVVHITPRHPRAGDNDGWPSTESPYAVLKNTQLPQETHQPAEGTAHKVLLQALLRDALYDFRREVKSDMIGLHLDIVRMGRGWRKEMREVVDQWEGELRGLRVEVEKLREENERLRAN